MNSRIVPGAELNFEQLPKQPGEQHEALVDLFGRYIMWMRNWNNESTRRLVESPETREKLGAILGQPFEKASQLSGEDRDRAIGLAEASVDAFIKRLLQVLAHRGSDFAFGNDHALRLRIVMELVQKENGQLVQEEVINRGGQKHFADYWGKWLNRFHDEKTPESK
jgi:hypothetical protein